MNPKYLNAGKCDDITTANQTTDMWLYPRTIATADPKNDVQSKNPKHFRCRPGYLLAWEGTAVNKLACSVLTAGDELPNCNFPAKDATNTKYHCSQCANGYTPKEATAGIAAGTKNTTVADNAGNATKADLCAAQAGNWKWCLEQNEIKDKCDVCEPGYVTTWSKQQELNLGDHNTGVCVAFSSDRNCQASKTNASGECLVCRNGYYFNGTKCQTGKLLAPAPNAYDMCMEAHSDGSCKACFNDGNATEGFKKLSATEGGNCQTKMDAKNYPSAAVYASGLYTGTGAHDKRSFYCPSGQTFKFNTDPTKSTCETTSSPISDCLYHAQGSGANDKLECVVCKDGKQQKDAAGTACQAGTTTNAKSYATNTEVHECNTDYVKSATATCKAWKASTTVTLDANCREIATYGSDDVCVKCKWGYYFSGAWCAKGTAKAGSSSTSSSSTSSSTSSTTAKSAAGMNIFAAAVVLAIAAAFN